jgi:hypothetical protein
MIEIYAKDFRESIRGASRDLTFFVLLLRGTVARIGPARIRLTPDSIETTPELRNTLHNEIWSRYY